MKQSLPKPGRIARYGAATASTIAIALIGGPAVLAQDDGATPVEPATITMEVEGKRLLFAGPETVIKGQELEIVNNTSVRKVGPHTFSLAKKSVLPDTAKEFRECFTPGKVCMDIANAHKFNPRTEKIAKPVVDAGAKGWNRSFRNDRSGDSWYTETKDESFTRRVTASAGTTLRFICAIHPDMQGKIKVVAGE
jgi:plastocyanin